MKKSFMFGLPVVLLALIMTGCPVEGNKGEGNKTDNFTLTITPSPTLTDESISGFPAAPFTISKTQTPSTHTIEIAEGYTTYMWYVDDIKLGNSSRSLTLNALNYSLGKHTVTAEVYKNRVPYSKELIFTVVQ